MNMFQSLLNSIPKNRSEMVEDLEIPEITLKPYVWTEHELEPEDISLSVRSESILSDSMADFERGTLSTDSSIPLSRAMTDSEIDYGFYKRFNRCGYSDPVDHMRAAMDAFPPGYLASLNSYISTGIDKEIEDTYAAELKASRRRHYDALRRRMARYFDEECRVFTPDDPGLLDLHDAVRSLDMKVLDSEYSYYYDWPWRRNWRLYDRDLDAYPYRRYYGYYPYYLD